MITSGYVSRIPLLNFDNVTKEKLNNLGNKVYNIAEQREDMNEILIEIDNIINGTSKLSKETISYINKFKM